MAFNPYTSDLPVTEIIDSVKSHLSQSNTLIISAPPGAGKSTLLPLTLLNEPWLEGKKILMLEPRRLAARTIAMRMADLWGDTVGATIGYRIRFENKVSDKTQIEVVTEGILTRMLHTDNALEGVGLVIFDEFHERSIHADVAMALCREAQQVLRPDLRIMIMSATLNIPQLISKLNAPVAESKGKQYPVVVFYGTGQDVRLLPEITARTVIKAMNEHDGDALVFLPGEGDIRKCAALLKQEIKDFAIHPLYGQLPQHEQYLAIVPNKFGKRKIVLATSIAETSLTIEGVKIVVDTGYGKVSRFDPKSGLSRLETVQISKDSADQRAGRAGRLSAGVCYRMWTKATHERLAEHRIPEILEADLAALVLDLALWGVTDVNQLTWLSPPPKAHIQQASEVLHQVGALENGKITEHGKQIHQLACHPRLAHMLLMAKSRTAKQLATDIAAVLEERDPLPKESGIDINLRIEALRRGRENNALGNRFARIEKVAESYRRLLNVEIDNGTIDPYETGLLLAYAYPERIAFARSGNNAQFQLANGKYAAAGHRDDLSNEPWLAIAHIDTRDGLGKIFMASPLNPKDLLPMVKEQQVITWDTRKGGLIATKDLRIGSIVLQSKPLPQPDEKHLTEAISNALKTEGEALLLFDEQMEQLQNRIKSLRKWNPQDGWPDVSTPALLFNNQEWLGPYLTGIKKPDDLKKINLAQALLHHLDWEQQQALAALAPAKIEVPSGSNIGLQYLPNGETPILAVRLQEVFGLAETPTINAGKTPVVMHLLSPGFKPVQVTSDLKSFWNNTYIEVKNELKRRYPKHAWPDDPWNAPPVAKGSHKKSF
ncbi:DEAD/DEAH box helicase [Bacteroidetes bacterium UKL13-3]|nr:DEAD/DEAH box helicase [Bacteroidetes bacterium UKL13-3]HCP93438.1 ATP-dependent helicase HrpB [Bacteroidota bacterium]